ncbi:ATP-binding cassette domain-containing protein [Denitrobacterium detoxificans]|jgi:NHLM bacteriocin system ABC transporter ATP-binding protein|uniref:ATP-binding cassette domain-containing protein n=1 Tax=Denitrobacterium detoxificans TaxID=79604 RepID=UPI0026EB5A29|nr:ATP-binding cassette domain-containing protein [Denitrobacterium detoxificans]MBE6466615.1 ATP-binding cassette domain-containing protein [Denitrobacterium detoxificans]
MGLFDEQIRQRKQGDQAVFEDSILRMASAVVGTATAGSFATSRIVTKEAVDDILKYYGINPVEIPPEITDPDEQLEYALRPHGIMHRMVGLGEDWYKDAIGPMIAYRESDGTPVPVFPKPHTGYWFRDERGRKTDVNAQTIGEFAHEARCFYRPLPLGEIGITDLFAYMRQCVNAVDVGLLVILALGVTLTGMVLPIIAKMLTGFVVDTRSYPILWSSAAFLLCAAFSQQLISATRDVAIARIRTKVATSVSAAVMMRVLSLPTAFFRKYSAGELASRCSAANSLVDLLITNVVSLGITALFSLLYVVQIGQFAPALMLPAVLIIVATVAVNLATSLVQMRVTRQQMKYSAKENGKSFALINGVQKIKLAGAEKRAFAQWARAYTKSAELEYNPPMFLKLSGAITSAVSLAGAIVLYYLAVVSGMSPSDYVAFFAAYGMVMAAFASLSEVVRATAQIRPYLEMVEPILRAEPEVSQGKEILTRLSGRIELNDVYFRYNEQSPYMAKGLNLRIRPGEYLAIVGKSGCGKSTLVRLLLGFETPEKGAIYYDGRDMANLDLRSLRRRIGTVTQDGMLFSGDIYSNITISAPQLSVEDAWRAAEIADIADDIRAMPQGMSTMISEGSGGISGGQKQRLMIARAVAPRPHVLIFDEATSALDNRTQQQVSNALDELNCTRIVIAHRLSTIKNCDRILYLEDGCIVEDGTYEELVAKGGLFAELVERQRLDI